MSSLFLRISLTVAQGPMFHPLHHTFSLYLSGMIYQEELKFSGSVSEREQAPREFTATRNEFQELCRAAEAAGLAERLPRVEAKVDTSDSAVWALLHVEHEKGVRTLTLGLMSTGYEGPDAPALHRFFRLLFFLANVQDDSVVHDLAGR